MKGSDVIIHNMQSKDSLIYSTLKYDLYPSVSAPFSINRRRVKFDQRIHKKCSSADTWREINNQIRFLRLQTIFSGLKSHCIYMTTNKQPCAFSKIHMWIFQENDNFQNFDFTASSSLLARSIRGAKQKTFWPFPLVLSMPEFGRIEILIFSKKCGSSICGLKRAEGAGWE